MHGNSNIKFSASSVTGNAEAKLFLGMPLS
jgi:hypothetical protein